MIKIKLRFPVTYQPTGVLITTVVRSSDLVPVDFGDGIMTGAGTDWEYTWEPETAGLIYNYTGIASFINGFTSPFASTITDVPDEAGGSLFVGRYHTTQDVYDESGKANVIAYATLGATDDPIEPGGRIERAMIWSEAYIDDWMAAAGKVIPLVTADGFDGVVPPLLKSTAAKLTTVKLYGARGQNDVQDPNDDEAIMTRSMVRSKDREAHSQLSFWARPTCAALKLATGVVAGGGAGVIG